VVAAANSDTANRNNSLNTELKGSKMGDPMRVRAAENGGTVDVKILMKHDMESGQRRDAAGKTVPAWFISTLNVKANGKDVFNGQFGPAVSKDPFLNFKYKGAKGDKIVVTWNDSKGDKRTDEATVS
jgi:sulfur-oxidizing protein SoxZ